MTTAWQWLLLTRWELEVRALEKQGQRNDTLDMNEGEVTASLGTAWQYCISTRIALEHEEDPHFNPKQIHTRKAVITKSLISKKAELNYEVTLQGFCEVIPRER